MTSLRFTILGEPASKANSRKIVINPRTGKTMSIKSDKALSWASNALRQIPPVARLRIEGRITLTLEIFYATERPDMDESIVLDVLQDQYNTLTAPGRKAERVLLQAGVYRNDRQVRERHVYHRIDRTNPRVEVHVQW
jgi:Holliday junction resolvase RusA-like endonuclease